MGLRVITFADSLDDRIVNLEESCKDHNLVLEVLGVGEKWIRNAFKLRLLNDYLHSSSLENDDVLLVVDAFDVVINAPGKELLETFDRFGLDIVFSGEANYYFRNRNLSGFYWRFYPRIKNTVYHYLNSGSFIGRVRSLKKLMDELSYCYGINYSDDEQLEQIRSDQSVYSRYYADYKAGVFDPEFTLGLDAFQELMGCSGGRMHAAIWPKLNWLQDYLVFKYERKLLKALRLVAYQNVLKDLTFDKAEGKFKNKLTKTSPAVIHLPGTYKDFGVILKSLKKGGGTFRPFKPLAVFLSLIGYIRSVLRYGFIHLFNKGRTGLGDIYPIVLNEPTDVHDGASDILQKLGKGQAFILRNDKGLVSDIPAILMALSGKKVIVLEDSDFIIKFLREKGIDPIVYNGPLKDIESDSVIILKLEKIDEVKSQTGNEFMFISTESILSGFRNMGHDYWLLPKHRQFATFK